MGSFTKRLGPLAARSRETEGASILKNSRANKQPGSLAMGLDKTLKDGHDMRIFGLGTAAALATIPRYGRFTVAMHAVYSEMEHRLDRSAGPVMEVWQQHGDVLRRSEALAADLRDVGVDHLTAPLTAGTGRLPTERHERGTAQCSPQESRRPASFAAGSKCPWLAAARPPNAPHAARLPWAAL